VSDTNHFTLVKERVDLEDYLGNELGVQLVAEGQGTTACCPFHDEDTPSFKVSESDEGWKRWYCFGACQEGGTIIDAVMRAEGFELPNEAVRYLNDLYSLGLEIDDRDYKKFAQAVQETEQQISKTTSALDKEDDLAEKAKKYLNNRGLSDSAIANFELGIDREMTNTGRISIPLRDSQNHPVSIAFRALFDGWNCSACGQYVEARQMAKLAHQARKAAETGQEQDWKHCPHCQADDSQAKIAWLYYQHPKYRFRGGFEKREFLYNEHQARRALKNDQQADALFVSEGYGEVWAGWMAEIRAYVCYSGASLSDWQARRLVRLVSQNKEEKMQRPIVLVPDFDSTGLSAVHKNIAAIRQVSETQEIQIVEGIDQCQYTDHNGDKVSCKDLGDIIKHFGPERVGQILQQRMPAAEWQIRDIVNEVNPHTGQPFHSTQRQMHLVAGILSAERSKATLDHLIPYLAQAWGAPLEAIRQWFYSNLSADNATSYQHLFKGVEQARAEAREFLNDDNIIGTGFESIDGALPGGGMRPGQLAMILGKSGTGKALSLDAQLLAADGQSWIRMGDVQVGDQLYDPENGQPCTVRGVYPQGPRQMYRVHFHDGTYLDADADHLWAVDIDGQRRVLNTSELISTREQPVTLPPLAAIPEGQQELKELLSQGTIKDSASVDFQHYYQGPDLQGLATAVRRSGGVAKISGDAVHFSTAPGSAKRLEKIYLAAVVEAQCIAVDSEQRTYVADDYTVTHNTMLSTQLLANFAQQGKKSIFFTLEQASKSLYPRLACQVLGLPMSEIEELVKDDSQQSEERLAEVNEIYENMLLIDNVPTETQKALPMTPNRIRAMIQEANLTHFKGQGANVVIIDYLSILQPNDDAPNEVKSSDDRVPGYNMLCLFEICKELNVLMIVLQQLPKEVKKGVPFSYDSGRGGSRQTDACDYIYCIWRPDQNEELSEEDRLAKSGQYKIALGKNRYGASTVEHAMFDTSCLRILPPIEIAMPGEVYNEALIEISDPGDGPPEPAELGDEIVVDPEDDREEKIIADGEAGKNAEALAALSAATDNYPQDAQALLADISSEDPDIDPDLRSIFES